MGSRKIMFLPQDLLSELNFRVLTAENRAAIADSDFEWHVERLMEAAFQRGYEDGYMRRLTEEGSRRVADDQLARERAAVSAPTTDTAQEGTDA